MKRTIILIILIIITSSHIFAQKRLALIKDKDGYTNIRANKGTNYEIVGTIKEGEFFNCEKDSSDWLQIEVLRKNEELNNNGNNLKGYVHKSRIKIIEELPLEEQKNIITTILNEGKSKSGFEFTDTKYDPILDIFPSYYYKTKDSILLNLLFETLWIHKGSANEIPSFTISKCYICDENTYLNQLKKIKNYDKLWFLINDTDWGLRNHFNIEPESENITNKEYLRLIKQLKKLLKKKTKK